jgi:hypothetical protein
MMFPVDAVARGVAYKATVRLSQLGDANGSPNNGSPNNGKEVRWQADTVWGRGTRVLLKV